MPTASGSGRWIKFSVVAALLLGAAASHKFVVPSYPVFPKELVHDGSLANFPVLAPSTPVTPHAVVDEGSRLPDATLDHEAMKKIMALREFDFETGQGTVKELLGDWAFRIHLLNLLLVLASCVAGILLGLGGGAGAGFVGAALVWGAWNYLHLPTLALQVKLWACTAFTHHTIDTSHLATHEAVNYFSGLAAQMKLAVYSEAGLCIAGSLLFAFLYDRLTNHLLLELEGKNSELMSIQASMFKYQNADTELKKLSTKFQSLTSRLTVLQTFTQEVGKTLKADEVCAKALQVTVKSLSAEKCTLYLYNENSGELESVGNVGWSEEEKKEKSKVPKDDTGLIARAIQSERIQSISPDEENQSKISFTMTKRAIPSVMCAPLIVGEKKIGVLNIEKMESLPEQDEIRLFYYIATLTGMAVENSKLFQKTENLANFDGLTQLYTNRYMQEFLDRKLEESRRYKHPISVVLTDIDHFKDFNTIHGHLIGDFVLKETAKVLKGAVRNVDIAARYGGEEFIAVLPETDYKGAYAFAERLRRLVEAKKYTTEDGKVLSVTLSAGVAQFPLHHTQKKELIEKADQALYMAKDGGRNQVKVAPISKEALKKYQESQAQG